MSLHDLSKEPITPDDFPLMRQELIEGTDRSAALVGCSVVDVALMAAIVTRMVFHNADEYERVFFAPTAPLGSLSAKIRIGKALGLYQSRLENSLNLVRRIRNTFAHSAKPLPFTHPLIVEELSTLPDGVGMVPDRLVELGLRLDALTPERSKYVALCLNVVDALEQVIAQNVGKEIAIGWLDEDHPEQATSPQISEQSHPIPDHNPDGSEQAH